MSFDRAGFERDLGALLDEVRHALALHPSDLSATLSALHLLRETLAQYPTRTTTSGVKTSNQRARAGGGDAGGAAAASRALVTAPAAPAQLSRARAAALASARKAALMI